MNQNIISNLYNQHKKTSGLKKLDNSLRRDITKQKPTYISLELADTCFFRCKHCDIWKNKPLKNRLTKEELEITISKLKNWLGEFQLSFNGGEPFSNPLIISAIKFASSLGIKTHANSNAFLLNEKYLDQIINSGLESLSFSIDGTLETHDQNRGRKEAFSMVEKAITYTKNSNSKMYLTTTTVLMSININQVKELLNWGEQIGLQGMWFQPLWENFRYYKNIKHNPDWFKDNDLWPDQKEAVSTLEFLIDAKKQGRIVENSFEQLQKYIKYYSINPKAYAKIHPCYVGVKNFSIMANGDVQLCFFFDPVGNILKQNPEEIWNNANAQKMRGNIRECTRGCRILLCNIEQ